MIAGRAVGRRASVSSRSPESVPEPDVEEQRRRPAIGAISSVSASSTDPAVADDLDPGLRREQRRGPLAHAPGGRRRSRSGSGSRRGRLGQRGRHSSATWVPPLGQRRTSRIAPICSARCCMFSSPKCPPRSAAAPGVVGSIPGPASSIDSEIAGSASTGSGRRSAAGRA